MNRKRGEEVWKMRWKKGPKAGKKRRKKALWPLWFCATSVGGLFCP